MTMNQSGRRGAHDVQTPSIVGARPLGALVVFRMLAGVTLACYFVDHLRHSVPLATGAICDAATLRRIGIPIRGETWVAAGALAARVSFAAGVLSSAALSVGMAPRFAAALIFCITVSTYRALLPTTYLDDFIAIATAFWLAVLPGPQGAIWHAAFARNVRGKVIPSEWTASFVLFVSVLYISLALGMLSGATPTWTAPRAAQFACILVPAFLIAPSEGRVVGAVVQVVLHVYFVARGGPVVAHVLLAGTGLVLWTRSRSQDAVRVAISLPMIGALTYAALLGGLEIGRGLLPRSTHAALTRLAFDLGVLPEGMRVHVPSSPISLLVEEAGEPLRTVQPSGVREQLRLVQVSSVAKDTDIRAYQAAVLRRMLASYCPRDRDADGVASIGIDGDRPAQWSFLCVRGSPLPDVLPWSASTVDRSSMN